MTNLSNYKANARNRDLVALAKILSPLIVCFILAMYFKHFVVSSILAHIEINGLIIGTIFYGTFVVLSRFFNARKDFSLLERFGREAIAGRPMNEIVEEPWLKQRYIRHYIKHVAALEAGGKAAESNMHAIESELHALNDEYNSRLELPQFLVGFMIALGLLGTFIGLLETLTGISTMLEGMVNNTGTSIDEQFMKLVGELRKPLEGMGIAFAASMFGLVGSLVLAIKMINLRRYIARVIMCARNVMHDIVEIKKINYAHDVGHGSGHTMIINAPEQAGGLRPMHAPSAPTPGEDALAASGFTASSAHAADSTMMLVANRIDLLANKLEPMIRTMEGAANGTNRLNELLGFGPRMKETSERTYEEIRTMGEYIAAETQCMRQLVDVQTHMMNGMTSMMETQRQAQAEHTRRMTSVVEKLGAIDESGVAAGRHLWEMRESFAKLTGAMAAQEMLAASVGQQTMLIEALLQESRQTRQWLAQIVTGR